MLQSQNAFSKGFGVKTEKSYLFKFWKNAFSLKHFPRKARMSDIFGVCG